MASEYVYQGVWPKWDGQPWIWVWTVTNLNAVIIMAFIAAFLALTQGRTWIIIRYLFLRITQPNRLPDDLEVLSQRTALKLLGKHFCRLLRLSRDPEQDSKRWEYGLPAWIGLWAAFNCLAFSIAGVIIPWLLTDGALGAPEVRSQGAHYCARNGLGSHRTDMEMSMSIWEQCHKQNGSSYCDPNFMRIGSYSTSIDSGCIFPSQICLKDQPIATFTRANMTPYDLGINSNLKMTVSHRIQCSPISLTPFIHESGQLLEYEPAGAKLESGNFTLSLQAPRSIGVDKSSFDHRKPGLRLDMWTDNGPSSGLEIFRRRASSRISILPWMMLYRSFGKYPVGKYPEEDIHPLLQASDARTFVIVLRSGAVCYSSSNNNTITDPFFKTHNSSFSEPYHCYLPEYEATGIGCREQTQVCIDLPGRKCYPWTQGLMEIPRDLLKDMQRLNDVKIMSEYMSVFWGNLEASCGMQSLQAFLEVFFFHSGVLQASKAYKNPYGFFWVSKIDPERQWISELTNFFQKSIYWQKFGTLNMILSNLPPPNITAFNCENCSLCDKILLIDADFTNINWIGMWITIGALQLLCTISYAISLLEWASRSKASLMDREVWQQLRINTSKSLLNKLSRSRRMPFVFVKWIEEKMHKDRDVWQPDVSVDLRKFPDNLPI